MNERIQELFEKAANKDFPTCVSSIHPNQLERFAELIVKECMNMCADSDVALQRIANSESPPDSEGVRYGAADYEYAEAYRKRFEHYESIAYSAKSAGDKISEHFGVEE